MYVCACVGGACLDGAGDGSEDEQGL